MPHRLRLLRALRHEVEFDRDLELAPARLFDFERGRLDHAQAVGVGIVQFELYSLEPVGYIGAIDTTHKDFPTVCMVGRGVFRTVGGVKWCGFRADDC